MADKRHLSLLALIVVPVPAPNRTNMQLADRNESTASAVWLPSADAVDDKVSWSPHNTLTTQIKQARWVTALWISHGFRFHNSAHLHLACLCDAIKISGFVAPPLHDGRLPEMCCDFLLTCTLEIVSLGNLLMYLINQSIGACRWRCCSCECPPSCSVLSSPKPWHEAKIKLAQIFLHRS